jgi:hypothetical protein
MVGNRVGRRLDKAGETNTTTDLGRNGFRTCVVAGFVSFPPAACAKNRLLPKSVVVFVPLLIFSILYNNSRITNHAARITHHLSLIAKENSHAIII